MNLVITTQRPYGVAAYVKGMRRDIERLRLPENKVITDSLNPDFALRRIGGFRSEAEVEEWCKAHRYWYPSAF